MTNLKTVYVGRQRLVIEPSRRLLKELKLTLLPTQSITGKNLHSCPGALPSNGLLGMCRWMGFIFMTGLTLMGSPFQTFSTELPEWGRTFSGL